MVEARAVSVAVDDAILLPQTTVSVDRGTALMVRGHNGAGKSTLLKVIAGIRAPTSGTIIIGGRPASKRSREFRRRVTAMIGLPPVAHDLTVRDHIELIATTWFERPVATSVASDLLDRLGLAGLERRFPHELSTGQLQLAALAMVLARPFDVLLLDEPEQRLDPERLGLVADVLAARRDAGASVIVATHSSILANRLGDEELDLGLGR
jgi:ABC-type multidrug transport system ATPase subunit